MGRHCQSRGQCQGSGVGVHCHTAGHCQEVGVGGRGHDTTGAAGWGNTASAADTVHQDWGDAIILGDTARGVCGMTLPARGTLLCRQGGVQGQGTLPEWGHCQRGNVGGTPRVGGHCQGWGTKRPPHLHSASDLPQVLLGTSGGPSPGDPHGSRQSPGWGPGAPGAPRPGVGVQWGSPLIAPSPPGHL